MKLIQSDAPLGSRDGRDTLYALLGTRVLENIAGLRADRVLSGQPRPGRLSPRRRFPPVRRFYEDQPPVGRQPGHHHVWPEIATVVEGHLDMAIGRYTYRAKRGDWLVMKPEIPHGECRAHSRSYYCLIWFELDRPFPNLHVTEYRPGKGYVSFGVFGLPQLPPYLRVTAARLSEEEWPSENQARMHLLRLVTWVMELLDQNLHAKLSKAGRKVLEVQKLIVRSEKVFPSVKDLAARVGLSANYLSSLFHSQTGTTIRQYIANRRIEKAKVCLADPNQSIKEVAYRLGFQNPHHFSNAFRHATGVRPSVYRLSVKGDSEGVPLHVHTPKGVK